jgi:hypothetical protein
MEEVETIVRTEGGVRVSIDQWDEGGVWVSLQARHSNMHFVLTREEAEQVLKGLQAILAKEVAA